jgi:hypothetical protein
MPAPHAFLDSECPASPAPRVRARAACAALLAVLASAAGCGDRAGRDVATAGAGATWRWRAVGMEVSALTTPLRARKGSPAEVDVRIEFFDSDRDETKAIGQLQVVCLFDSNPVGRAAADLSAPGGHARSWDSVTETYSVRVPLSVDPPPGRVVVVQASFEGVDGARMTASREVRWPETDR